MKLSVLFFAVFLQFAFYSCRNLPDYKVIQSRLEQEFSAGNYTRLKILRDSIKNLFPENEPLNRESDSLVQIADRIRLDFQLDESYISDELKKRIGQFTEDEKSHWESKNWLECKLLDGEKRYFNRSLTNLDLLLKFHLNRTMRDSLEAADPDLQFRQNNTEKILKLSDSSFMPVLPVKMVIDYEIVVDSGAVPAGETVKCWLPFPRKGIGRQGDIKLISASQPDYKISPDSITHSTVYMEAIATEGSALHFSVSFSYSSSGQFFDPALIKKVPYDKNTVLYEKYTAEQLPHICFTRKVTDLADSITGEEKNPIEVIRKIFHWFNKDIPWTGAREYSTIPNIPEYVINNRRGDCGMKTFLLMSMLRYKGIPARWQSGWMVPPAGKNLHDWCEVYFEGTGWVPLDVDYGLQYTGDQKLREFFISGIDSYRLIINDGIAGQLSPPKKFLRSEPYDFQRGEVEWKGGNLYFDKWEYEMRITYN